MPRKKLKDAQPTGVLAERQLPDHRRKIKLRREERAQLQRQQTAEAAAALFLDLETERTWAQIAEALSLSPSQLRDLTKTAEFDAAYNQLFAELGHDPRFRAAQAALSDMLPLAVRELKGMLTNARTPAGVKLRAIERILLLNGLQEPQPQQSDRNELAKFLVEHHITIDGFGPPQEYAEALAHYAPGVIDGQFRNLDAPELPQETE